MKITSEIQNIVEIKSDAMIYSTNTRLALTGGVGSALINKFGNEIQVKLINQSQGSGTELAEIGDVISLKTNLMPWKMLLHTVITDGSYIAAPAIVESVIEKSFNLCSSNGNIRKITISELGTGYGSLTSKEFHEIIQGILNREKYQFFEEVIVCKFGEGRQKF